MSGETPIPEDWRGLPLGTLVEQVRVAAETFRCHSTAISSRDALRKVSNDFAMLHPQRIDYKLWQTFDATRRLDVDLAHRGLLSRSPEVFEGTLSVVARMEFRYVERLSERHANILSTTLSKTESRAHPSQLRERCRELRLLAGLCLPQTIYTLKEKCAGSRPRVRDYLCLLNDIRGNWEMIWPHVPIRNALAVPSASSMIGISPHSPWPVSDTWLFTAVTLVNIGGQLAAFSAKQEDAHDLVEATDLARDIAQSGWLTMERLAEEVQGVESLQNCYARILRFRPSALFTLAQCEKLCLNHVRAAQYASCFTRISVAGRNRSTHGQKVASASGTNVPEGPSVAGHDGWLGGSKRATMIQLADRMGLSAPDAIPGETASTPNLLALVLRTRTRELTSLYGGLLRNWNGFDSGTLNAIAQSAVPAERRLAFVAALKSGNLRWCRRALRAMIHNEHWGERRKELINLGNAALRRFNEEFRTLLVSSLTIEDLMAYADAVAAITQKAGFLTREDFFRYREGVRSLWKRLPDRDQLGPPLVFFVHHVLNGLALHGLVQHPMGDSASWLMYDTASETERESALRGQLERIRFGGVRALGHRDFLKMTLDPRQVFVSICIRGENEISIVAQGPEATVDSIVETQPFRDINGVSRRPGWEDVLGNFRGFLEHSIKEGVYELPAEEPDVTRLGRAVLEAAIGANPLFSQLCLHAPPLLRQIPWQYLFQSNRELAELAHLQFQNNRREGSYRYWHDFCVWLVPGLQSSETQEAMRVRRAQYTARGHVVRTDESDPLCGALAGAIRSEVVTNSAADLSRLSIVAHGSPGSNDDWSIDFVFNGQPWDRSRHEFAGYGLTILHTCAGGYASRNGRSDMGGHLGWLMAHGSRTILASPVAIPVTPDNFESAPLALERYFANLGSLDPGQVETQYMNAIREKPHCSLYSLIGWEVAPVLVQS